MHTYQAYLMGIDKRGRLILEDISSTANFTRDHCWVHSLAPDQLLAAKSILAEHYTNALVYFKGEPYHYDGKQSVTNISQLTHEDHIMKQPIKTTISRRTKYVIIKLQYKSVNTIITNLITSLTPSAHKLDVGSDHITITYLDKSVEAATISKLLLANVLSDGSVEDVLNQAEHIITGTYPTEHKPEPTTAVQEPVVEPIQPTNAVQVFVKLPKSIRVFNAWDDISAIHTTSGIVSRSMLPYHNTEQLAVTTNAKRTAYRVDGLSIPSNFVTEVSYSIQATFNCEYQPSEFLRIEHDCIVIQRDNEVILLSNALMQLHDQSTTVIEHDGLHYLTDDTLFANPISKQIMSTKRITNKG